MRIHQALANSDIKCQWRCVWKRMKSLLRVFCQTPARAFPVFLDVHLPQEPAVPVGTLYLLRVILPSVSIHQGTWQQQRRSSWHCHPLFTPLRWALGHGCRKMQLTHKTRSGDTLERDTAYSTSGS